MEAMTIGGPVLAEAPILDALTCYGCKVPFCETCELCHEVACLLTGMRITTRTQMIDLGYIMAKSQKAKGFVKIAEALNVPKPFRLILDEQDIAAVIGTFPFIPSGLFVRPCPMRPRHGFVESRVVESGTNRVASVLEIFHEARKADPEAELLITPAVDASHNVILTPALLAVGIGNDGATAGKKSTSFPLTGSPFSELPESLIRSSGVNECEDPYIEAVIKNHARTAYSAGDKTIPDDEIFITQLRAGARIPPKVDRDFVPQSMVVESVMEASGDLLEWERQVTQIKPGTAVYHLGGTLVSHYGVHCLFNRIPIMTTRIPAVGETIEQTLVPERPLPQSVANGLTLGISPAIGLWSSQGRKYTLVQGHDITLNCNQAATFLLVAAHNAAALGGEYGTWIGLSAALMLRLGMAASHGEIRHKSVDKKLQRNQVYDMALNSFLESRRTIGAVHWKFKNLQWESGFGGELWAKCTDSLIRLDAAAQGLLKDKSEEAVTELITALHNAINQAHNGGWWLDKFVGPIAFDHSSVQSVYSLVAAGPPILAISGLEYKESYMALADLWANAAPLESTDGTVLVGPTLVKGQNEGDGEYYCEHCEGYYEDEHDHPDEEPEATVGPVEVVPPLDGEILEPADAVEEANTCNCEWCKVAGL